MPTMFLSTKPCKDFGSGSSRDQRMTNAEEFRGLFTRLSEMPGSENAKLAPHRIARIRDAESLHDALALSPKAFLNAAFPPKSAAGYIERARCGLLYTEVHDAVTDHKEDPREVLDRLRDPSSTFMEKLAYIDRAEALRHIGYMFYGQKGKASPVAVTEDGVPKDQTMRAMACRPISVHSANELSRRALCCDFGFFDCSDDKDRNPRERSYYTICVQDDDDMDSPRFPASGSYFAPRPRPSRSVQPGSHSNPEYPSYFLLFKTAVLVLPGIPNGGVCALPFAEINKGDM